ncbi:unnamed protein product [Ostreobium quekettii]|uniref:Uncharacterized protein n=1 Tax=Ostreobium quekettii TaxID=121088 RepID=A0A8S1J9S2_9CHLO|nr:unnamed protein product [Ostreobium quekettii]
MFSQGSEQNNARDLPGNYGQVFHPHSLGNTLGCPSCFWLLYLSKPSCVTCCEFADTYDVYITSSNRVKLIDFNPIGGSTSPLLFTWCELGYLPKMDSNADGIAEAAMATTEDKSSSRQHSDLPGGFGGSPPIRVVGDQSGMMLGQQVAYGMPFDMIGCSVEDMVKAMGAEEGAMG